MQVVVAAALKVSCSRPSPLSSILVQDVLFGNPGNILNSSCIYVDIDEDLYRQMRRPAIAPGSPHAVPMAELALSYAFGTVDIGISAVWPFLIVPLSRFRL